MKRNNIYALMLFLLALLPAGLSAQSVTGMQYWFDDGSRHTVSISEGTNTKSISTDGLSVGMHTLYYRFTQSGGDVVWEGDITDVETGEVTHERVYYTDLDYSPVYSAQFFKHDESQGSTVEYWFDNRGSSYHATTALTGAEGETVTLDLSDISKFPLGFHQLNMRFSTPGKSPSAVYSADVMKFSAGSRYLQYWVDDNYSAQSPMVEGTVKTAHLDDGKTRDDVVFSSAQLPLTDVAPGLHHLYYRTCDANGVAGSAVYSAIIFRHASEASQIEYWFDDDLSTIQKKQFAEAYQNGATYTIDLTPDVFPQGLHQLNIRVSTKNGSKSAIYSTPVVKMDASSFSTVEFWLDDDRSDVKKLSGSLSIDGVAIVGELTFDKATPGMHYLHYRAVGKDGKPSNAVGEWPVMVKSRYNTDGSNEYVTSYSISVDNKEVDSYTLLGKPKDRDVSYVLDARDLSLGQHNLTVRAWNSLGTNAAVTTPFNVQQRTEPALDLTAEVKDGKVSLRLPSIPNDLHYRIIRKNASGASAKVISRESVYPADIICEDEPGEGQFTYYAQGKYQKDSKTEKSLRSADVTVSVGASSGLDDENSGYIVGYTVTPEQELIYSSISQYKWDNPEVLFEVDGKVMDSSPIFHGKFSSNPLPVGTQVTLELHKVDVWHVFEPVTVTIKKGQNMVYFTGELKSNLEPNSLAYDLELTSDVEWKGGFFVFEVKNRSNKGWKGKVRFRAINESNYKKLRKQGEDLGNAQQAQLMEKIWFYSETEEELSLGGNEKKTVYLPLNNVFPDDKRDYYYFYLESIGRWTTKAQTEDEVKQLAVCNNELNVASLPFNRQIDKSSLENAVDLQRLQDAEYAASLLLAICSTINGIDKSMGNIRDYFDTKNHDYDRLISDMDGAKVNKILRDKSMEEIMQMSYMQKVINRFMFTCGVTVIDEFRENIVGDILKSSKTISEYLGPALDALQSLRDYENSYQQTEYEKMFNTAHNILDFAKGRIGMPFSSILSTYLDVTESIINYALKLGKEYYTYSAPVLLYENIPETEVDKKKFKWNRNIDFKIMVSPKWSPNWFDFAKRGARGASMIKSAVVKVNNIPDMPNSVATVFLEPVPVDDGIMLRQVGFDSGEPKPYLQMSAPFNRMWMEIHWKNGRTTMVPLLDEGTGVKFDQPDIWGHNTYRYTVYFDSEATSDHFDNLADIIRLKE